MGYVPKLAVEKERQSIAIVRVGIVQLETSFRDSQSLNCN